MDTIAKEKNIEDFIKSKREATKLLAAEETTITIPEIKNAPFANYSKWFRNKPKVGSWPLENINNKKHYLYKGNFIHDFQEGFTFSEEGLMAESYGNTEFVEAICGGQEIVQDSNDENTLNIDTPIFIMSSRWGFTNYWHWVLDVIPKVLLFINSGAASNDIPCVIYGELRYSYQQEWLEIVSNYAKKNAVNIIATNKRYIRSKELIWANSLALPHASKTLKNIFEGVIRETMQQKVVTIMPERILLMRRQGSVRSIRNYEEIRYWGERNCFKIILAEEYSAKEQIKLFAGCKVLVSIHGAGMSNIVFMEEKSKVIELSPDSGFNPAIQDLCAACNVDYSLIICKGIGTKQELIVNTISLDDALIL